MGGRARKPSECVCAAAAVDRERDCACRSRCMADIKQRSSHVKIKYINCFGVE